MKLSTRVLTAAAVLLAAGTASAATFTFTNALGNGLWFSETQSGPTWTNNWGQSGPASGQPTPGAADTANLVGPVTGNGNINVAVLNNPAAGSFTLTGSSLSAGSFTNNGTFGYNAGHKTFAGAWTNSATGTITLGEGGGWGHAAAGLTVSNAGTINLPGGAGITDGVWTNTGTINKTSGGTVSMNNPTINASGGMIMSSAGVLQFNSPAVSSSASATWVTTAANTIRLNNPAMSGTFVGNHNGLGAIGGNPNLVGNTTLSNTGAGTQPWIREGGGTFTTGAFALTNAGGLLFGPGYNTFVGTYNNSGTITLDSGGYSYVLNPATTFNNTGTVVLSGGHTITGTNTTSVINNAGAMTKTNGGTTTVNGTATLNNNAGGSINATNGAITVGGAAINSSASSTWTSTGAGAINLNSPTITGTFNGTGARSNISNPTLASNVILAGTAGGMWDLYGTTSLGGFTLTNTGQAGMATTAGYTDHNNGSMVNATNATWTVGSGGGYSSTFSGTSWTNNGLIAVNGSHALVRGTNPFTLTNNGTLRRDAGGTLTITNAATTHNGAINHVAASASTTTVSGGSFVAGPASSITIPSGVINFNSVGMAGTFNANLSGGSGNINTPTVTANSTLNATGTQPWNINGAINTGAFTLTNIAQASLAIGGGYNDLTGTLVNAASGTFVMGNAGGYSLTLDNGTLTNAGTMNVPGAWGIVKGTNAATFTNTGTINRTGGGNFPLNSLTTTLAGTLNHDASNCLTTVNNGTFTSNGANYVIASGSLGFNSVGIAGTFNGTLTGSDSFFSNCGLVGNVTLNTTGATAWDVRGGLTTTGFMFTSNGQMSFNRNGGYTTLTGNLTNAATGTLRMGNAGGYSLTINSGTLTNNGAVFVPGGYAINGAVATSVLANNGTFTHEAGGSLSVASMTVNNAGLLTTVGGGNTTFSSSVVSQTGSGVVRASAGTTTTFSSTSLSGGRLEGSGVVNSNGLTLTSVRLAPGDVSTASVGTLTSNGGNITFGAGSVFEVDIDRPTGNPPQVADKLVTTSFNQTVNLGGAALDVRRPSGYTPSFNVEHVIVDVTGGGTLTGTFASVTEANPLPGYGYRLRYTPTQVIMKVVRQCNLSDVSGPNQVPLFDGAATADDIIVFLGWYFAGDLRADFAGANQNPVPNGQLTADDIIVFLGLYFQGCGF